MSETMVNCQSIDLKWASKNFYRDSRHRNRNQQLFVYKKNSLILKNVIKINKIKVNKQSEIKWNKIKHKID